MNVVTAAVSFAGFATEFVSHCFEIPATKICPDAAKYFDKGVFLTYQTNLMCCAYYAYAFRQAWMGKPGGHDDVVRKLFPLSFGVGSFVTIAYYALDHWNPVSIQRRRYWEKHGYPSIDLLVHAEHLLALPAVLLQALTWEGPRPSWSEGARHLYRYIAVYVAFIHFNWWLTGAWVYPFIDQITEKAGATGRTAFFAGLMGISAALAKVGVWIANQSSW
eukprot:TRINITY_DN998_c5_g1_i3.p1 TRINITY_DN998_c5_g1~~TRINITY_DN998_c5_g1_i3.p1  ORF type:complete len:219 (+),score=28.71 TRINITY_DN998_c5_g1_i3:224-880(+)